LIYRSEGTYALGTIILDSLQYEPRDLLSRIVTTSGVVGTHQVLTTHYDGVGAVLAQEAVRAAGSLWSVQEFRPDAFGNVVYSRNRGSSAVDDAPRISGFSVAGALMERTAVLPATPSANNQDDDYTQTVLHGRVDRESELTSRANVNGGGWVRQVATRHYYDGLNRLAVEQRYDQSFDPNDDSPVAASGTWEEHAYDALGRRVRVRSRATVAPPTGSADICGTPTTCYAYTEWAVWDGSTLLEERRDPDGTSNSMNSGTIGYVDAIPGTIDQPLAIVRNGTTRIVNYDWRGLGESSAFTDGTGGDCALATPCATEVEVAPGVARPTVSISPSGFSIGGKGGVGAFLNLSNGGIGSQTINLPDAITTSLARARSAVAAIARQATGALNCIATGGHLCSP
jgi:hypothetical protein